MEGLVAVVAREMERVAQVARQRGPDAGVSRIRIQNAPFGSSGMLQASRRADCPLCIGSSLAVRKKKHAAEVRADEAGSPDH